jgi:hypothetical protein
VKHGGDGIGDVSFADGRIKMKNKSSDLNPSQLMNNIWIPVIILIISGLTPVAVNFCYAGNDYTVETIANLLTEVEGRYTDICLDYSFIHRAGNKPFGPKIIIEARYAEQNYGERKRYYDRKQFYVKEDPNKDPNKIFDATGGSLMEDCLVSFDGQSTTILDRKPNDINDMKEGEAKKTVILRGYNKAFFPFAFEDPHAKIWYFAGTKLGDFIKEHSKEFRIESLSENINGVNAIKIIGNLRLKTGEMTMKLWVSPDLNFLPIKRQIYIDNKPSSGTVLSDFVRLQNGLYYPTKIQSPDQLSEGSLPRVVHMYKITRISTEMLSKDFFTPRIPPNTKVYKEVEPNSIRSDYKK